jgi:two-component system alkaline phosphatase synthesis response regulator PhoP
MAPELLLLEDEANVGSTLQDRLGLEGFTVRWAKSVEEAKSALEGGSFRIALLDVNLPDGSGFDVARKIRDQHPKTAVVFLTAAGTPEDRIHGLELGAEDYVVKPFHFKELVLRIQNVLKRARFVADGPTPEPRVKIGRCVVNFQEYQLEAEGRKVALSHKECALLKLLYEKRGQVVSRDEILDLVWSEDEYPTPRTVDNFIVRLRKLVEPDAENPTLIRSVRGVGYLLEKEPV